MAIDFGNATPILRVANLDASLAYYRDALGFHVQWVDRGFASVGRGRASLMLSEGDQGRAGTWIYVGVSDADALYDELRARGAAIRHPPTNYPWGARELHVSDPDGHVLRFGADARPGEPMGEWLDGEGQRWLPQPDGSWRRATSRGKGRGGGSSVEARSEQAEVRAYLAALPPGSRRAATTLRKIVRAAAPGASEGFSYKMPCIRLADGRGIVWYAAWKAHCSLYPLSASFVRENAAALAGYEMSKGTIRFQLEESIPVRLVTRLVKARLAELRTPTRGSRSRR